MKRIMLVLTIALVVVAMLLATAGAALAAEAYKGKGDPHGWTQKNPDGVFPGGGGGKGGCGSACE